jgi:hypothetical protein
MDRRKGINARRGSERKKYKPKDYDDLTRWSSMPEWIENPRGHLEKSLRLIESRMILRPAESKHHMVFMADRTVSEDEILVFIASLTNIVFGDSEMTEIWVDLNRRIVNLLKEKLGFKFVDTGERIQRLGDPEWRGGPLIEEVPPSPYWSRQVHFGNLPGFPIDALALRCDELIIRFTPSVVTDEIPMRRERDAPDHVCNPLPLTVIDIQWEPYLTARQAVIMTRKTENATTTAAALSVLEGVLSRGEPIPRHLIRLRTNQATLEHYKKAAAEAASPVMPTEWLAIQEALDYQRTIAASAPAAAAAAAAPAPPPPPPRRT